MEALLNIAYWLIAGIGGGLALIATIARIVLFFRYRRSNKTQIETGITGEEAARMVLDSKGLQNVEIVRNPWYISWIFGNHYSVRKKRIGLRKNIWNKKSVTSVGIACQKAGLAVMDHEGNKWVKTRAALHPIVMIAPYAFIPILAIGVLADIVFFHTSGVLSLCLLGVLLLALIATFIFTVATYKQEKKANQRALEYIKEAGFMSEKDMEDLEEVFKTFEIAYIFDMLTAIAEILKLLLQILMSALKMGGKKSK